LESPGTELNDFNSFHLGSHYLNTKYIAEQYVLEQVERNNLNASIIYPTFMIGANDSKPSSGRLILYGLHNYCIFAPPGGKNFVHVLDVATVCVKTLTIERPGENYLVAGQNYSYKDFFRILAQVSGKKRSVLVIPKWLFFIAAYCFQLIKGRNYEFNLTNARVLGRDNYYSGDRAYNDFSYTPTPIEIALKDALEWFKKSGLDKQ
jgi:dihydroflavonol-4-reductase